MFVEFVCVCVSERVSKMYCSVYRFSSFNLLFYFGTSTIPDYVHPWVVTKSRYKKYLRATQLNKMLPILSIKDACIGLLSLNLASKMFMTVKWRILHTNKMLGKPPTA